MALPSGVGEWIFHMVNATLLYSFFFWYIFSSEINSKSHKKCGPLRRKFISLQAMDNLFRNLFPNGSNGILFRAQMFLLDGAYGNEVIFNKAGTKIIATKYHLRTKDMQSPEDEVGVMVDLRNIAAASDLNVSVHSGPFKFFDQVSLDPLLLDKSE